MRIASLLSGYVALMLCVTVLSSAWSQQPQPDNTKKLFAKKLAAAAKKSPGWNFGGPQPEPPTKLLPADGKPVPGGGAAIPAGKPIPAGTPIPGGGLKLPLPKDPAPWSLPAVDASKKGAPATELSVAQLRGISQTVLLVNSQTTGQEVRIRITHPDGRMENLVAAVGPGLSTPDDGDQQATFFLPQNCTATISITASPADMPLGRWSNPQQVTVARATRQLSPLSFRFQRDLGGVATTLRIVQYNAQFFPSLTETFKELDRGEDDYRAREIARRLADGGYDIICLNEMFDNSEREDLIDALRRHWERSGKTLYQAGPPDERDLDGDGGVIILSSLPIIARHQIVYRKADDWDYMANKGALHVRVQRTGLARGRETIDEATDYIDLFATHLQAPADGHSYGEIRTSQLRELAGFIQRHSDPSHAALLLGDLNITATDPFSRLRVDEYRDLLPTLARSGRTFSDLWLNLSREPGHTSRPLDPATGKRIDYILHAGPVSGAVTMLEPVSASINHMLDSRVGSLSDHSALEGTFTWRRLPR